MPKVPQASAHALGVQSHPSFLICERTISVCTVVHPLFLSLSTISVSSPLFSPNLLYGGSKRENKVLPSIRASKDGHPPLNRLVQSLFQRPLPPQGLSAPFPFHSRVTLLRPPPLLRFAGLPLGQAFTVKAEYHRGCCTV